MIPIAAPELLSSPIHPRKISVGDQLFEERPPRPGEMIKEAVQMAVWPALPRSLSFSHSLVSYGSCTYYCLQSMKETEGKRCFILLRF
ncbi:hypothetical protein Y032_0418g1113 [Ancylostoma ceylanicum]|nr:hypothetical protein Y032_0418g1113 [Ancylostoma ceylanicum]